MPTELSNRFLRVVEAAAIAAGRSTGQGDKDHSDHLAVEAMRICTEGLNAYFISHVCAGSFDRIYPQLLDLPVHNLDLDFSHPDIGNHKKVT